MNKRRLFPRVARSLRCPVLAILAMALSSCGTATLRKGRGVLEPAGPFRLEFKLQPGTELAYEFASNLRQRMSVSGGEDIVHAMKLAGSVRQAVAEVEDKGKVALAGAIGKAAWQLTSGVEGTNSVSKDQAWVSAFRVERNCRSVRREPKGGDKRQGLLRRAVDNICENTQICAPFPAEEVTTGSKWEGDVLLPTPGTRQPGRAVSFVTGVGEENGARYCVIRSLVTSTGEESHKTWKLESWGPEMEVKGTTEGRFDIERGIWLETKVNLQGKFAGRMGETGFDGIMNIDGTMKLKSAASLDRAETARFSRRIKSLDNALKRMFDNDFAGGIEMLAQQEEDEKDPEWKKSLETVLTMTRPIMRYNSQGALLYGAKDAEMAASSLAIYRQAGEHMQAGETKKALEAYRKFLALKDEKIPAGTRLLAQYRAAALLETLGEREKALAAYRSIKDMNADDDYSRKLQEKAAERLKELEGRKGE